MSFCKRITKDAKYRVGSWVRSTRFGRYGMRKRTKRAIYHVMAIAILIGAAMLGYFRNPEVFLRFWEAVRDFFHSLGALFTPSVRPTVMQLPHDMIEGFPKALEDLAKILQSFGDNFISKENFFGYLIFLAGGMKRVSYFLLFFGTFAVLPFVGFMILSVIRQNNDYAKQSKPLRFFLWCRVHIWDSAKRFFIGFYEFFKRRSKYMLMLILILCFFLNAYTILFEFFAYYFYFLFFPEFSFANLGGQIVKLLYDISLAFRYLPVWVWVLIGFWIFDKIRRKIGYRRLELLEDKLRDFIEERGIIMLYCGSMRTGKTTLVTSVLKSLNALARKWAKDGMRDIDMKFPNFPWITLERMLRKEFNRHRIYNLYTVRQYVKGMIAGDRACWADKGLERRFRRHLSKEYGIKFRSTFFGYNREINPTEYDGGLGIEKIEDLILDYAQLYLIYIMPSLLLTNYAVRMDNDWFDNGNFPEWDDDFFRRDPDSVESSIMSHILNQDMLRPGKQMDPDDPYVHSFEFGFVGMIEIGKERGNQHDLEGVERKAKEVNQKNDLYDAELKLMGHLATIYHIPFIRFVCDEQRPENWGANARELCDIITIRERGRDKILMPFFAIEEAAYLLASRIFGNQYDKFRFNRGDMTLTMYLLKSLYKKIYNHYHWIENTFGGHFVSVKVEKGTQDEKAGKAKLFVASKKVYANVFATDAWKGLLEERVKRSSTGLDDVPRYRDVYASIDEFRQHRSYFCTRAGCGAARERMITPTDLYLKIFSCVGKIFSRS